MITKLQMGSEGKPPWRISKIIQDCRALLRPIVVVLHVPRSCNKLAHQMVTNAAKKHKEG